MYLEMKSYIKIVNIRLNYFYFSFSFYFEDLGFELV